MAWKGVAAYVGQLRNAVSVNRRAAQVVNTIVMQETQDLSVLNKEIQTAVQLEASSRAMHAAAVGVLNTLRNLKNSEQRHLADSLVLQKSLASVSNMMNGAFTRVGSVTPAEINRDLMSVEQIKQRAMRDVNITMQNSKFYGAARAQLKNMWMHYAMVQENIRELDSGIIKSIRDGQTIRAEEQQVVALETGTKGIFQRMR